MPNLTRFIVLLAALLAASPAMAVKAYTVGWANITVKKAEEKNIYALRYLVQVPSRALSDVWIRLDLKTTSQSDPQAIPPDILCEFMIGEEKTPGYDHAHYRDGALYLYFERLEPDTKVQFFIGWAYPGPIPVTAYTAALSVKSEQWRDTDYWRAKDAKGFKPSTSRQIAINGDHQCSFL